MYILSLGLSKKQGELLTSKDLAIEVYEKANLVKAELFVNTQGSTMFTSVLVVVPLKKTD